LSLKKAPAWGANQREEEMDIVSYWKNFCTPYLRARFGKTERGAALVEYALLLALIAVVCIIALTALGGKASSKFIRIGNSL
jgi:pilus assembly protein Flp/PilA